MKFPTTQWHVIDTLKADSEEVRRGALGEIIAVYGAPLLAFALRHSRGARTPEDCEDLVNDFFLRCVTGGILTQADRARGRFRSFLVTSFKYYINNAHRSQHAQRRAPAGGFVSIATLMEQFGSSLEPRTDETPEDAFARVLRRSLFARVLHDFEARCRAAGDATAFRVFLMRDVVPPRDGVPVPTWADVARACALPSENAANKVGLAARQQFRALLLEAVARDCATPEEAQAECELVLATALAA